MKRALIMGLNYIGSDNELGGCINDTINLKSLLMSHLNYSESDITIMTDNSEDKLYPNHDNIIKQLDKLISESVNENLGEIWISYSGHGSYTRDTNGDEDDGNDEILCPLDFKGISDDTIIDFLRNIPKSCRVFCLFDCCHSGTICDLQYKYSYGKSPDTTKMVEKKELVTWECLPIVSYYRTKMVMETIPGTIGWYHTTNNNKIITSKVISLSGCRDPQTSADVFYSEIGKWNGALTKAFIDCIRSNDVSINCLSLSEKLNKSMENQGLSQKPVMCSSYKFNNHDILFSK